MHDLTEARFTKAWNRLRTEGRPVTLKAASGDRYLGVKLHRVSADPFIVRANLEFSLKDGTSIPLHLATPDEMDSMLRIRSDIQKGLPSLGCVLILEGSTEPS